MHPQLVEILAIIKGYVDLVCAYKVGCKVRLTTNGILEERLKLIPAWVQVRNSSKDPKVENRFETYNVAPKDKGVKHALACSIPWRCGIGVDCYGYYPCGAGAGVARVFGLSCGAKSLADATADQLRGQMKALCQYCGHSESCAKITSKQETSESWVKAFAEYRANKKEQT